MDAAIEWVNSHCICKECAATFTSTREVKEHNSETGHKTFLAFSSLDDEDVSLK